MKKKDIRAFISVFSLAVYLFIDCAVVYGDFDKRNYTDPNSFSYNIVGKKGE